MGLLAPVCGGRPTDTGVNKLISILSCTSWYLQLFSSNGILSLVCGADREQDCFQPAVCICRPGCCEQHACVVNNVLGGCTISSADAGPEAPVPWPGTPLPGAGVPPAPPAGGAPQGFACSFSPMPFKYLL